jgi:hypothetical protein
MRWRQSVQQMPQKRFALRVWVGRLSVGPTCILITDKTNRQKIETNKTVYPKGYVEMLERQQKQLIAGVQLLYRKVTSGEPWVGDKPLEYDNQPRIHDVLAALDLLQPPQESDLQIQDFETYCSSLSGEDPIDEILSIASDTRKEPARSIDDDDDPVQLDAWSPYSKIELAGPMDLAGQESPPETDTTSIQSLPTMQFIVIPHQPEPVSLDWISIPFDDTLFPQSARRLDNQTYDWEPSTLLTTSPAHSRPFKFDIDPTNLMSAATYSRRGHLT